MPTGGGGDGSCEELRQGNCRGNGHMDSAVATNASAFERRNMQRIITMWKYLRKGDKAGALPAVRQVKAYLFESSEHTGTPCAGSCCMPCSKLQDSISLSGSKILLFPKTKFLFMFIKLLLIAKDGLSNLL